LSRQDVLIEPLTEADVDALVALARAIWLAHYPAIIGMPQIEYMLAQRYSPVTVRAELRESGLWWDKLMVGGVMAGFASYFLAQAGEMKLDKLYVHPRHQRCGYGGRMIERAGQVARARGCSRLVLAVNKHNETAIAAYLKHGFLIAGATVKDIGSGFVMDDYVMVRALIG
jgi:GNAT superfamily N-acetyltransferase